MAILNYTTSIEVEKSAAEIQAKLAKFKATAILTEYDTNGVISHISFKINTQHGLMAFRVPANIEGVFRTLLKNKKVPRKLKTKEQAARVAWRIVKDWIEAQLAIVEAEMVTMAEVFLPYAQTANGTVYEQFAKQGFKAIGYSNDQ